MDVGSTDSSYTVIWYLGCEKRGIVGLVRRNSLGERVRVVDKNERGREGGGDAGE